VAPTTGETNGNVRELPVVPREERPAPIARPPAEVPASESREPQAAHDGERTWDKPAAPEPEKPREAAPSLVQVETRHSSSE
jgi:hypothetical protein